MLKKDEIPGDQVSRHRRYKVALVSCSLLICAFSVLFTLIAMPGASATHEASAASSIPTVSSSACVSSWSHVAIETIRSGISGHFVTADLNASGELRTYTDTANLWEQFEVLQCGNNHNTYAFRSLANGNYVSTRLDNDGLLMALVPTINTWEEFEVNCDGARMLCDFQSLANGSYVSTRMGDPGEPLIALAPIVQSWELFTMASPLP